MQHLLSFLCLSCSATKLAGAQLKKPLLPRMMMGYHTHHRLGETAHAQEYVLSFVSGSLVSVSYATGLEASSSSLAPCSHPGTLEVDPVGVGAVGHVLVLRRLARRAFRHGTGSLCGQQWQIATAWRHLAGVFAGART